MKQYTHIRDTAHFKSGM